ncbi:MAG TPA: diguanylate cyclase, partial [Acidimicrobiales bacterium]|nr:diguanylate cyclase [Acidimicrobiales bacterium]
VQPWEPIQVSRLAAWGDKTGQLRRPTDVAIDPQRRLVYVADADAGVLASRLLSVMTQPLVIEGQRVDLSMSIGVAVADGVEDPSSLIAAADTAMYRAKRAGRSCYRMAAMADGDTEPGADPN